MGPGGKASEEDEINDNEFTVLLLLFLFFPRARTKSKKGNFSAQIPTRGTGFVYHKQNLLSYSFRRHGNGIEVTSISKERKTRTHRERVCVFNKDEL